MSGAYIVQKEHIHDPQHLAAQLSSAMSYGNEQVNHFTSSGRTVLGLISPDRFHKGPMPVYAAADRLWVILLGELHESAFLSAFLEKHQDIRDDMGVFARLHRSGELKEALPALNGAFFVILFDPEDHSILAANDRYGLYPMYWASSDKGFCLAARSIGPVIAGVVPGDWDLSGVAQLLAIDDYLGDTTLVAGVHTFPQASIMRRQGKGISWHTYWHYDYTPDSKGIDESELAQELGRRFLDAVRRQCGSGGRIGVTLSGGLDSRSIVAAASRLGIPVKTFTWGKAGSFDRVFAAQVADLFSTEHHDCDYSYRNVQARFEQGIGITEGLINYFDCHMLFHLHILKDHADTILNGYAGDLILGGSYLKSAWMSAMPKEALAKRLFAWRNALVPEHALQGAIPDLGLLAPESYPSAIYASLLDMMPADLPCADTVDRFYLENRVRRSTSMGTVLMREVVESAACFFEYDLLDLTTAIPYQRRFEHSIYREMMKRAFPEALTVRWQRTLLPASLPSAMDLPAKAFLKGLRIMEGSIGWPNIASRQSPVDFSDLVRGVMRPWMEAIIADAYPACDQVLSPHFCERIWERHKAGENLIRLLGAITVIRGFSRLLAQARSGNTPITAAPAKAAGDA